MILVPFGDTEAHARAVPVVAEHLRRGGLIAYPTETIYGFGCALRSAALDRLAALKAREGDKPFLLLVSDREAVDGLEWNDTARRLADAFWPGPLTLVLRAERPFPDRVTGPGGTVAVRATPHRGIRALLRELGEPITSTSVNLAGETPAATVERVVQVIEALKAPKDLWVLDGGTLEVSPPSTLVDCTGTAPRILRPGAVSTDALRSVLDEIDE